MTSNNTTTTTLSTGNGLPFTKLVVAAGTYEGVLAGWELKNDNPTFRITFATPVHEGSIRGLSLAHHRRRLPNNNNKANLNKLKKNDNHTATSDTTMSPHQQHYNNNTPGLLVSCGYDEALKMHDFSKRLNSAAEVRTPADLGYPTCAAFAPPLMLDSSSSKNSTHCLVGFAGGKLVLYQKKDWSVQHILAGHDGGLASVAVHPSGKMALTGGAVDGKLKLWDLVKGRLAYVTKTPPSSSSSDNNNNKSQNPITCIVWTTTTTTSGVQAYGYCYGNRVTVRSLHDGTALLDTDLPSKVNQICFLTTTTTTTKEDGDETLLFVAAACNDGSLPVLAVNNTTSSIKEIRAVMAIEPVEGPVAGEERFKCIQTVVGSYVVTANSAGVVSLMNLQGAIHMLQTPEDEEEDEDEENNNNNDGSSDNDESSPPTRRKNNNNNNNNNNNDDDEEEEELAVDIIDGVQLGTGARITCLSVWCTTEADPDEPNDDDDVPVAEISVDQSQSSSNKGKRPRPQEPVTIDDEALRKARKLVASAKKIQNRKSKKKKKQQQQQQQAAASSK